jgi:adenylate cyclase
VKKAFEGFLYPFGGFCFWGGDPMATDDVKRKLTAIFSADVEGYSRLMGEDELATVQTLTTHKETMRKLIKQYKGRVVDSTGDNLLAEFASVVDAVQCAVEVQQILKAKNEELPEKRRMFFRIGINLGDVIEEDDRIFGDGVNIAARVESLAEGGGISISGTAYDQLGKKLPLGYEYLGEQSVKNIEKPVRVYRVLTEAEAAGKVIGEKTKPVPWRWATLAAVVVILVVGVFVVLNFYLRPDVEPASVEKMAYPLPDRPSIVVLPFTNLSDDPKQEYFSDGITAGITRMLYKMPNIFVISRASAFTYKGKAFKIRQVAEEMGVRYVLEGSVQKIGERIRVNVQLIDALTGEYRWAESYDRELKDVFAVQDEIIRNVVTEIAVEVAWGDMARGMIHATENIEANDLYMKADKFYQRYEKESNAQARELLIRATELDPKYARAIAFLGWTYIMDARFGWVKDRTQSTKKAEELAKRALTIDDTDYLALILLGGIYAENRLYEQAISTKERAVKYNPNNAIAIGSLAVSMIYTGRTEEALVLMKKMNRISPYPWGPLIAYEGWANYLAGRYEAAITLQKKFLERQQHGTMARISRAWIIAGQMALGRMEEAQAEAEKCLEKHPDFSVEAYTKAIKRFPFKDYKFLDRQIELLRKAGLPEIPPLSLPDKPSIAVLPFVNMTGDPEQEYLSDGIAEEIITALSKVPDLFVIARNSSFTYKGKSVLIPKVGRELGVRYVLEGSVRKAGNEVRITAKLVDAKTGNHLWAERYDRDLKDIFDLYDEITMQIVAAMQLKLTEGETARLHVKGTDNLEAYIKWLQANYFFGRWNPDDNVRARKLAKEVIDLDPEYPAAYRLLALTHVHDVLYGSGKDRKESIRQSINLAQKALSMDDSDPLSHWALGRIYSILRQYEKAIVELKQALSLNPNLVEANGWLGVVLNWAGRPEEALPLIKKARRLSPTRIRFSTALGQSYLFLGRYEEAIEAFKEGFHMNPNNFFNHLLCALSYLALDREQEAHAEAEEAFRINPNYSVEASEKRYPTSGFLSGPDLKARWFDLLRKVGFK